MAAVFLTIRQLLDFFIHLKKQIKVIIVLEKL